MKNIAVDFSNQIKKIKCLNAVNNGPAGSRAQMTGNFKSYKELEIPYARLHDSAFYSGSYGGEFSVDVHRVFPNFDADENDPASYVFLPTDSYLLDIESVGTKIFYRLGAAIEHGYKYGTYPPKDFSKWARICEHIIRHYTEGWANGYKHDIEYWEIWNEFDLYMENGTNPCWQGTREEFYDFYCTVSKYLKEKFPHLKIGGPASSDGKNDEVIGAFLEEVKKRGAALDFYSYHWYGVDIEKLRAFMRGVEEVLNKHGFGDVPVFLNEWNYNSDKAVYSASARASHKGASFIGAVMSAAQKEKVDMLMYYDARPATTWNGVFGSYGEVHKPFYTFKAAKELVKLGNEVKCECDENLYAIAASDGNDSALFLTHYNDDDTAPNQKVKITFSGAKHGETLKAEIYLIDKEHDLELVREEYFTSEKSSIILNAKNYDVFYVKFENTEL